MRAYWYDLAYFALMFAALAANWHFHNTQAALTFAVIAAILGAVRVEQLEKKLKESK